jgi:hypothetical protein
LLLRFRTPTETLTRRFLGADQLSILLTYLASRGYMEGEYKVSTEIKENVAFVVFINFRSLWILIIFSLQSLYWNFGRRLGNLKKKN